MGWFRTGGHETVLFVPATKGSELRTNLERIIKRSKVKMKVVEKNTMTIKSTLMKPDPFSDRKCSDSSCMVCTSRGYKGNFSCRTTGITYKIECETGRCGAIYT